MDSLTTAVEAEVRRRGGATALHWQGTRITLGEINRAANRVARVLLRRGLDPEDPIAVLLPRGPEQIVAVLAILKAGGAYVPLDRCYPAERVAFILKDAGCRYVLNAAATPLPGQARPLAADHLVLEDLLAEASGEPDEDLPPVPAERLAYIMYTSGSTGQPKGVEVPHTGLALIARAGAGIYREMGATRLYQFFGMCFDTWGYEVFMALIGGLELVSDPIGPALMSPNELFALLAQLEVDTVIMTPSYLGGLTRAPSRMPLAVTVCGEACPAELVRRWRDRCTLFNGYGPTEVTVACTTGIIHDLAPPVTIGRPYDHFDVLILDDEGRPVPTGESGEIVVAGPGIARGYRGRPELTAERFLPGISRKFPGARMYRTGDIGSYRPDGQLDFHGRSDDQIQLRGFRIEPGEVEAQIGAFPGVSNVAVVAPGEGAARRLVAFVAAAGLDVAALRHSLERRLPPQMVPSRIEFLDALPTLASGKADRQRLLRVAGSLVAAAGRPAPPEPDGDRLARSWAEALNLPVADDSTDFFELGGDSLSAATIICAAEEHYGRPIPLRVLYDNATLGAFRRALERADLTA